MSRLTKVKYDGKEYNACPICGDYCSTWAWNNYHHCKECEKLLKQGINVGKVRATRANDVSESAIKDLAQLPSLASLEEQYKAEKYDFKDRFPHGINIVVNDTDEARVLKDTYEQYIQYGENIPEFASIVTGIMQDSLELYRISKALAVKDTKAEDGKKATFVDRKGLNDVRTKIVNQINKSIKVLNDLRNDRASRSIHVLNDTFKDMLTYMIENDHEYHGIGICPDCNKRILFKTVFPTFRARWQEFFGDTLDEMRADINFDDVALDEIERKINNKITDESMADTYIAKWSREIEVSLM